MKRSGRSNGPASGTSFLAAEYRLDGSRLRCTRSAVLKSQLRLPWGRGGRVPATTPSLLNYCNILIKSWPRLLCPLRLGRHAACGPARGVASSDRPSRNTISKTHPIWHDKLWLSPFRRARRAFHLHPILPSQKGVFARAVMRAVPKMRLIEGAFNGPSGKRTSRRSAHCASCMRQFDPVKQNCWRPCRTDRADRSDRSFQMDGPEILYLLRVAIETRSCGGAVAIVADPWVPCDAIAPAGKCA
jgi:hypothetical protein